MDKENTIQQPIELKIFKQEDRKLVASILFDNGYTVRQGKRQRKENSKSVDYLIVVTDDTGVTSGK